MSKAKRVQQRPFGEDNLRLKDCHWCQLESYKSHASYPVAITNEINGDVLPSNFRFIEQSVWGENVPGPDLDFIVGCTCEDDDGCFSRKCACQDAYEPLEDSEYYSCYDNKTGRLLPDLLGRSRDAIWECSDRCVCSDDCINHVVARGRKVPLEIFRTKDRGWGGSSLRYCCCTY